MNEYDSFRSHREETSASLRNLKVREESWSHFHERHHSVSHRRSSEFSYGGDERPSWISGMIGSFFGSTSRRSDDWRHPTALDREGRRRRRRCKPRGNIRFDDIVAKK